MNKILFLILLTFIPVYSVFCQNLSYGDLTIDSKSFIQYLNNDSKYFSGGGSEYPYFQGKSNNSYIKFYRSTSTTCVIDLKSEEEYLSLVNEIRKKGIFRFKFCTDYQEPIVYNYETASGNKLRFNSNQMRISIEYPSAISSLMDKNSGLTTAFVCLSDDAYAFHTNLKCEGLGNCKNSLAKTNIEEAKKHNYSLCEKCTTDYNNINSNQTNQSIQPKESITSTKTSSNYKPLEKDYNYVDASSLKVSEKQLKKAEAMFEKYLPNLLRSKGEGASIYNQHTYSGDFTNDNIDDIIIWFVYGFGGTAIGGIEAAFYEVKNEEIVVVAGYAPDHRFSIDEIKNGTVYATKILYTKDDSQCCPSIKIPFKIKYSNNKLTVVK